MLKYSDTAGGCSPTPPWTSLERFWLCRQFCVRKLILKLKKKKTYGFNTSTAKAEPNFDYVNIFTHYA